MSFDEEWTKGKIHIIVAHSSFLASTDLIYITICSVQGYLDLKEQQRLELENEEIELDQTELQQLDKVRQVGHDYRTILQIVFAFSIRLVDYYLFWRVLLLACEMIECEYDWLNGMT